MDRSPRQHSPSLSDKFNAMLGDPPCVNGDAICNGDTPGSSPRFERQLGNSELSYYLPSRADGVNDMSATSLLSCSC
jgi:hypothetical protein